MADAATLAMSECDFFCCATEVSDKKKKGNFVENMVETFKEDFPLDPNSLAAGMGSDDAEDVCNSTMDANGKSCTWCSVAGICVSNMPWSGAGRPISKSPANSINLKGEQTRAFRRRKSHVSRHETARTSTQGRDHAAERTSSMLEG
jgi:hypothetical protein